MLINSGEIKTRVAKERQKTAAEINNYKRRKMNYMYFISTSR